MATLDDMTHEISPLPTARFFGGGQFIGKRRIECATTDVPAVLDLLDTSPNNLWPYVSGGRSQDALCVEADVKGKPRSRVTSDSGATVTYDRTWINLTYKLVEMIKVGGYYLWETLEPGLHKMSVPRPEGLMWAGDELACAGRGNITIRPTGGTYRISHYRLLISPESVAILWGKVNSIEYPCAMLGYTFGIGTMLCAGAHLFLGSPGTLSGIEPGGLSWRQAHYIFLIHLEGWNKVFSINTGQFEDMYLPTGDKYEPQTPISFTWETLRV